MAELDYAFLADYAAVQDGKLTAVGASFTEMRVPALQGETLLSIAGRIRCLAAEETLEVAVRVVAPDDTYRLEANMHISDLDGYPTYAEKRGVLFALQMRVPLITTGLYVIEVDIDGTEGIDRILKFAVSEASSDL